MGGGGEKKKKKRGGGGGKYKDEGYLKQPQLKLGQKQISKSRI